MCHKKYILRTNRIGQEMVMGQEWGQKKIFKTFCLALKSIAGSAVKKLLNPILLGTFNKVILIGGVVYHYMRI